jgi:hypothetical protein
MTTATTPSTPAPANAAPASTVIHLRRGEGRHYALGAMRIPNIKINVG